jgi:hypothetical protein
MTSDTNYRLFQKNPTSKFRASLINFGLVSFSIVFCLASIEVLFRFFEVRITQKPTWSDRPEYYYAQEDSFSGTDYAHADEKPADTFRIAAVGDSFTFPPGMQFDDAYSKRLERMLNMNDHNKHKIQAEVVNYGKWGAATYNEVKTAARALKHQADLVLLEITLNDAALPNYAKVVHQQFHDLVNISRDDHPLYYHWHSLGYVATRISNWITHRRYISFHKDLFENPKSWDLFVQSLAQIQALCAEKQVPLVAVVFPFFHYPLDKDYPFSSVHQKIGALLDSMHIQHLDLFDAYKGIPPERLVLSPHGDKHPNEIAHRIAAEQIYAWFERERFIPDDLVVVNKFRHRAGPQQRIEHL